MFLAEEKKIETDEFLIVCTAAGDERAFEKIVQRHQEKTINLIYSFLNQQWEAEEAAQEVFFKVWKNASRFKGKAKFSTWLHRITINTCLNYKRTKKKQSDHQDLNSNFMDYANNPELTGDNDGNPQQIIEKGERENIVNQSIGLLPKKQRMALILSRFEGYSYAEIAELMNLSLSSVESLLFRAKQNIAKILLPLKKKGVL